MRPSTRRSRLSGALLILVSALAVPQEARAQDFKIPASVSHFVYRPGEDAVALEEVRHWSFGLGVTIGVREWPSPEQRGTYGLVAHAAYGGPYWYWTAGAGMWNAGSPSSDNFGFGLNMNYNVFQSRDYRTRLGPQFGWSTASTGAARTHVFTYRAVMSHTVNPSLSVYGGVGAETGRFSSGDVLRQSTDPSLLAGISTRLGDRYGFSTGVESVFTDPLTLTFAGSIQFDGDRSPSEADPAFGSDSN